MPNCVGVVYIPANGGTLTNKLVPWDQAKDLQSNLRCLLVKVFQQQGSVQSVVEISGHDLLWIRRTTEGLMVGQIDSGNPNQGGGAKQHFFGDDGSQIIGEILPSELRESSAGAADARMFQYNGQDHDARLTQAQAVAFSCV